MFTGIIETVGEVVAKELREGDVKLTLKADESYLEAVMLGDSIACNGVCLTVVDRTSNQFMLDVSVETLSLTTIGDWDVGSKVNLEQAMIASSRFGGHIVSGHIDRIGEIIDIADDARSWRMTVRVPKNIRQYIAKKGSICVDGVSLTINSVEDSEFSVNIVPHTLSHTIIGDYKLNQKVNIEIDTIARYVERLVSLSHSEN
ncbi:MAG: riboflavin synthase [Porticoccaceae bacterium]|jgi:riboflavin synthase|nr:riboflavin synthase [Porticoccaceae bacterium]